MMRQEFRDRDGRLIGRADPAGVRLNGRDRNGRLVGWYDTARDETRDRDGRLVGHGNLLSRLIS